MKMRIPLLFLAIFAGMRAFSQPDPCALLGEYDFGKDRSALLSIQKEILEAGNSPTLTSGIEARLILALKTPGLSHAARTFICEQLSLIGGEKSVAAMAPLLADEKSADLARIVLERVPHASADDLLAQALTRAGGTSRLGLLHSLGNRGNPVAARAILPLLKEADPETVAAAATALGRIGTAEALDGLMALSGKNARIGDALLDCAGKLARTDSARASASFLHLMEKGDSEALRNAAFAGLATVAPADASRRILEMLASPDSATADRAIQLARRIPIEGVARIAADRLSAMPAQGQVRVLALLGELRDPATVPAVLEAINSPEESVRLAALETLANLPVSEGVVARVVRSAATAAKAEARVAAGTLARLQGPAVEAEIWAAAQKGDAPLRRVCIAALGDRAAPDAGARLISLRADPSVEIRVAALRALLKAGTSAMHADIVDWMVSAREPAERTDAERLAVQLGGAAPKAVETLLAADAKAGNEARASLARCLARCGGAPALERVLSYLRSEDATLALAAVRALGTWPDAAPLDTLAKIAIAPGDERLSGLATQGALQLMSADQKIPVEKKAEACSVFLEKGPRSARKLVLGRLADFPSARALEIARAHLSDPDCSAEAKAAVRKLEFLALGAPLLTASHNSGALPNMLDGNPGTRWTTNTPMKPGQWILVDLHRSCEVSRIVLDSTGSAQDYPRGLEVYVGDNPDALGDPAFKGEGKAEVTEVVFETPRRGRYIKLLQTGSHNGLYWSIHELKVDRDPVVSGER